VALVPSKSLVLNIEIFSLGYLVPDENPAVRAFPTGSKKLFSGSRCELDHQHDTKSYDLLIAFLFDGVRVCTWASFAKCQVCFSLVVLRIFGRSVHDRCRGDPYT
jgi:hypothetical protein